MNLIRKLTLEALAEWFGEKDPEKRPLPGTPGHEKKKKEYDASKPRRSLLIRGAGQNIEPHLHGKEGPERSPQQVTHHHLNKAWMSHHHAHVLDRKANEQAKKIQKGETDKAKRTEIHDRIQALRSKAVKWHSLAVARSHRAMVSYGSMNTKEKAEFHKNVDPDKWKQIMNKAKHDPDKSPVPHSVGHADVKSIAQDHQAYWHGNTGGPRKPVQKIRKKEGEFEKSGDEKAA